MENWHIPLESNQASKIWSLARHPWNIGMRYKSYAFTDMCQGFVITPVQCVEAFLYLSLKTTHKLFTTATYCSVRFN